MRHAAFVRAVMVGRDGLDRTTLLGCFEDAGARQPKSYISTGNVTFGASPRSVPTITRRAEAAIGAVVGRRTEVCVRSIAYLRELVATDPFDHPLVADAVQREVSFLTEPIDIAGSDLPIVSRGGHLTVFNATATEVFSAGWEVDGQRRGAGGFVERTLGQRVTTRAWTTVLRITEDPDPPRSLMMPAPEGSGALSSRASHLVPTPRGEG